MWEPQPLTTLRASKAYRGENFTLPLPYLVNKSNHPIQTPSIVTNTRDNILWVTNAATIFILKKYEYLINNKTCNGVKFRSSHPAAFPIHTLNTQGTR
jgi:hypothetical protein